jgi:hypothetical protein
MRDRVSPLDPFLKQFAPALVARVRRVHFGPQVDSQPIKIGTDGPRVRIASTETPIPDKFNP